MPVSKRLLTFLLATRFHEQANSSFGFPRKCWAVPVVVFGQNMKVRYFEIILKSIEYF